MGCLLAALLFNMSLKFFFNRKGKMVMSITALACMGYGWHLWQLVNDLRAGSWGTHGQLTSISFLIHVFLALLITGIRFFPWYTKEHRGAGIEEHFEKTLVPVAYIMLITAILYYLWDKAWPFLLVTHFFFSIILLANFVLIYLHFKDKDTTPPSYFARNLYK